MTYIVIALALIATATFKVIKAPEKKKLYLITMGILSISVILFILLAYYSSKTDCGAKYDVDLGCISVLPGWLSIVGFLALFSAGILSLILIFAPSKKKIK